MTRRGAATVSCGARSTWPMTAPGRGPRCALLLVRQGQQGSRRPVPRCPGPSAADLTADEELVAVWRSRHGMRFHNYRAKFTVLDIGTIPRAWIKDILAGDLLSANCPEPWRRWVTGRHYQALISTKIEYRSPDEQQPTDQAGRRILELVHAHFAGRPTDFERFAAHLWQMADGRIGSYEVTRATPDGGRDAVGEFLIGPRTDPVRVTSALEAKLFAPAGGGVGVKEASRVISRLRHRQFGVLVTTAHVPEPVQWSWKL